MAGSTMSKSEINNCSIQLLDPDPRAQKKEEKINKLFLCH